MDKRARRMFRFGLLFKFFGGGQKNGEKRPRGFFFGLGGGQNGAKPPPTKPGEPF